MLKYVKLKNPDIDASILPQGMFEFAIHSKFEVLGYDMGFTLCYHPDFNGHSGRYCMNAKPILEHHKNHLWFIADGQLVYVKTMLENE